MRILIYAILSSLFLLSCERKGTDVLSDWPWVDAVDGSLENWSDVSSEYGGLPEYIRIYKSQPVLEGKPVVAFIAVADMKSAKWDIWSVKSDQTYATVDSYKTPSQVYSDTESPVVINGGFFYQAEGMNYTSSLAVRKSEVLAYNINYASEDWVKIYYPTRAAFCEYEDGTFDACWTYLSAEGHYIYPVPALNSWEAKPLEQPSASFPEGAEPFAARTAIGGGPVLVNGGKLVDSYVAELFYGTSGIAPDTDHPRTAVGVTADDRMIFFVCEGRGMTDGVQGLTTKDVANVLLDLGCVEAINLDGGGSSCMLVNGKETIKVSDGSQRSVANTLMLK